MSLTSSCKSVSGCLAPTRARDANAVTSNVSASRRAAVSASASSASRAASAWLFQLTGRREFDLSRAELARHLVVDGSQLGLFGVRDALRAKKLLEILPQYRARPMPVSLIYPHRRNLSRRVHLFMAWLTDIMKAYVD